MAQECNSTYLNLEAGLTRAEVVEVQRKSGTSGCSGSWKIGLALLAIGLCAAAAVFVSTQNQRVDTTDKNEVLTHILKKRDVWSKRSAIHLEGEYNPAITSTVKWIDSRKEQEALKLVNNEIVIPETGLYFVYSRVSFRIDCHMSLNPEEQPEDKTIYLRHMVIRKHDTSNQTLLHELRSSCKRVPAEVDSGRRWYDTIYLGAVFNLEKNDRLSTDTSQLSNVDSDSGKTYFGVFAL